MKQDLTNLNITNTNDQKNTSWGGRFTQSVSAIASKFSNSIDVDSVLAEKDIIGSIAYAESLQEAGV